MSGLPLPTAQEVSVSHNADQQPAADAHSTPRLANPAPEPRAGQRVPAPDADLSDEICLMRTVLDHLAQDIPANHRDIVHTVGVLARVTSLHAKRSHGH